MPRSAQRNALLGVEHRIALQEGDFALGLFARVAGFGAFDTVGVDDEFAVLALADIGAQFLGLAEGEPQGEL